LDRMTTLGRCAEILSLRHHFRGAGSSPAWHAGSGNWLVISYA
jgi:hypothetical protein